MKILLIGGSGGIGKELYWLLNKGIDEVISVSSYKFMLPGINYSYIDADVVINLAALTETHYLHEKGELTSRILEVNCLGPVNILNAFLPDMRHKNYGRLIFMSSIYSKIDVKGQGIYSASKAFVDKLVRVAALENAEYGITVNSIQLGYTGLGMGDVSDELKQKALSKVAMKRFVTPVEIAATIRFIIDNEYYTGQNLFLGGGVK